MALPPVCVLLAGGQGTRLNALAWNRAKPAVPFAGIHRLIDFTLSNSSNSGIQRIGILTQYLPLSLMDHVGDGSAWDMAARTRVMKILPPQEGVTAKDWYRGTAHAVYQNLDFILDGREKEILILSGDHIYYMDYRSMLEFHRRMKADFTISTIHVPISQANRFGIAVTDSDGRIREFQEKPRKPKGNLGSMGIYIGDREVLVEQLKKLIAEGKTDIGGDLVPSMIDRFRVFAYPFKGYWRDVGTLESYWEASMDLLNPKISGLNMIQWNMRTNLVSSDLLEQSPAYFGSKAVITESYISQGCRIEGTVIRSVLSPGVVVEPGAVVEDSILFHNGFVGKHAHIRKVVADKDVRIGDSTRIGFETSGAVNDMFPDHLNTNITLLGKHAIIPENSTIGVNCLVYPNTGTDDWVGLDVESGRTVKPDHQAPMI